MGKFTMEARMKSELRSTAGRAVAASASGSLLGDLEQEFKFHLVQLALEQCDGNVSKACQLWPVHRNTFSRWLAEGRRQGWKFYVRKPGGLRPRSAA